MTDEEFIEAFEAATLPVAAFDHAAHVRAGWWYVRRYSLGAAIDRFSSFLRAFAAANGAAEKYHETVTVAWMLVIAERVGERRDLDWLAFSAQYPELHASSPGILSRYYRDETLASSRAKRSFVMPDRTSS